MRPRADLLDHRVLVPERRVAGARVRAFQAGDRIRPSRRRTCTGGASSSALLEDALRRAEREQAGDVAGLRRRRPGCRRRCRCRVRPATTRSRSSPRAAAVAVRRQRVARGRSTGTSAPRPAGRAPAASGPAECGNVQRGLARLQPALDAAVGAAGHGDPARDRRPGTPSATSAASHCVSRISQSRLLRWMVPRGQRVRGAGRRRPACAAGTSLGRAVVAEAARGVGEHVVAVLREPVVVPVVLVRAVALVGRRLPLVLVVAEAVQHHDQRVLCRRRASAA